LEGKRVSKAETTLKKKASEKLAKIILEAM